MNPKTILALGFTALSCACSHSAIFSPTTLLYTGNPISGDAGTGQITAVFHFTTPPTSGAVLSTADVASYSITFSILGDTITNTTATFSISEFTIGPDGLPASWGFYGEQDFQGTPAPEQLGSHHGTTTTVFGGPQSFSQDVYRIDDPDADSAFGSGGSVSYNSSQPGIWSAIPEPSAVSLLGLGALCFAMARRRNRLVASSHAK